VATLPRRPAEAVAAGLGVRLVDPPLALPSVPIYLQWHVRLREDRGHSWLRERFTRGEAAAGPEEPAD
jgi:DNA-binding transcriptional LysR family regulator